MSYIDDFVRDNAGRMTREELETSLRGAGYDDKEIRNAIRHAPKAVSQVSWPAESPSPEAWDQTDQPEDLLDQGAGADAIEYVLTYRDQFRRDQITGQLRQAGYDEDVIRAAWEESDQDAIASQPLGGADLGDAALGLRRLIGGIFLVLVVLSTIGRFSVGGAPVGAFLVVLIVFGGALVWWYRRRMR